MINIGSILKIFIALLLKNIFKSDNKNIGDRAASFLCRLANVLHINDGLVVSGKEKWKQ